MKKFQKPGELTYLLLIISIFISAVIETDIYLPAFTDMMNFFHQNEEEIQKILTWNFISLCISGPLYGPLSDIYGRRKLLLSALIIFLIGSIITLLADAFSVLLLGRILQGLGSGGCFTLGTAIIFDVFKQDKATDALNKINMIVPFIMASAPILGGYLNYWYNFRANFLAITLCVIFALVCTIIFLDETLEKTKREKISMDSLLKHFFMVLTNIKFLHLSLVISFIFSGFIVFFSSIAVVFIMEMGVTKEEFPLYQSSLLLAYLVASLSCSWLLKRRGVNFIKFLGQLSVFFGGLSLVFATWVAPKNPLMLTFAMIPYSFGFIWIQTPYVAEAMELIPNSRGIAASILTSIRLLITAAVISLTGKAYNNTIEPTTIAIVIVSLFVIILTFLYENPRQRNPC